RWTSRSVSCRVRRPRSPLESTSRSTRRCTRRWRDGAPRAARSCTSCATASSRASRRPRSSDSWRDSSTRFSRAGARAWSGRGSCPTSSSRTRCRKRPSAARAAVPALACPTCPACTWPAIGSDPKACSPTRAWPAPAPPPAPSRRAKRAPPPRPERDGMTADLAPVFREHRSFLWALSYRLTGNAADADDVVQETFVRALQRPPADRDRPWRPWLVRIAVTPGRDLLRRRRRRGGYEGQWLPPPIETEPPSHEPADEGGSPAARYDLLESVSFAFLLALEALTPMQRATLLLRDVFDYSGREAARALGISEASARTTHLRARRALAA